MKKILLLSCFLLISCQDVEVFNYSTELNTKLNTKFSGQKIYLCEKAGFPPKGAYTINDFDCRQKGCTILILNQDTGLEYIIDWETFDTYVDTQKYIDKFEKDMRMEPYCSYKEYENQRKQREEIEIKNKIQQEDCATAKETAWERRKKIGYDVVYAYDDRDVVNIQGTVVHISSSQYKVIGFTPRGILISTTCDSARNISDALNQLGGAFGAFGNYVSNSCKEKTEFIYTSYTSYATNEEFTGRGLLYARAGTYKYKNKAGNTISVEAYKETNYKATEIEYKTYLHDKTLRCQ